MYRTRFDAVRNSEQSVTPASTDELFKFASKKVLAGDIKLPITRLEPSQKSARGIHNADLALHLDQQRDAPRNECAQLNKR
ncbi:hypothetical protein GQL56_24230 [Pseudomonas putida]|nr:hypothetical protein [Pseudomonas putida]